MMQEIHKTECRPVYFCHCHLDGRECVHLITSNIVAYGITFAIKRGFIETVETYNKTDSVAVMEFLLNSLVNDNMLFPICVDSDCVFPVGYMKITGDKNSYKIRINLLESKQVVKEPDTGDINIYRYSAEYKVCNYTKVQYFINVDITTRVISSRRFTDCKTKICKI
jgi:hypothetical protein